MLGTIPILRLGDVLITTVHVELRDAVAEAFQADILAAIEKGHAGGLMIDISGLDMVDTYVARILAETGRMARLMGTETVLVRDARRGGRDARADGLSHGRRASGARPRRGSGRAHAAAGREVGKKALPVTSTTRREMLIASEDDVILVRKAVRALAESQGFDTFATAALTTATSELTRNVWVYARKGQVVIEEVVDVERTGIRVTFRDEGPGIADIPRVMAGGYSTARSMGLGLSGSRRLVDAFDLQSEPGRGYDGGDHKWKAILDIVETWLGDAPGIPVD